MDIEKLRIAQQGVSLAGISAPVRRLKTRRGPAAAKAPISGKMPEPKAIAPAGPFLTTGSLSPADRVQLLRGLETVIEGLYTHLPLKRARYAFDPVQRLRILRIQADILDDDAFHFELTNITTALRDAHTRYAGPSTLDGKVAALPFLVEMIGDSDKPVYLVSRVGAGLDAAFKPGVEIQYWNGVPIDLAVMRHGDNEVGGRPDSRRAWATQSLTLRSLRYGAPPDEHWVVVGYRTLNAAGNPVGSSREIKIPWKVVDPGEIAFAKSLVDQGAANSPQLKLGVDPAAADVRRAKMLLFAPGALVGEQSKPDAPGAAPAGKLAAAQVISTKLTQTLRATTFDAPGGPYGHLRIFGFETEPDAFVAELQRLIPLLPAAGLIIDVRGNPGGYILAAELALQLFTPKSIQPTRFSLLATPFTRDMAGLANLQDELAPWRASLMDAVRNGELYSQPIPISDPRACNAIGQQYSGPVVLVADSTTYSAGDLFSAGFVDNDIGPFVCVGDATGGGGANVWDYHGLRPFLTGSAIALPALPDGIGLTFSFRRTTRSGTSEGLPIEDVGIAGTPYALTRDDLLFGNRDLLEKCVGLLRKAPLNLLTYQLNAATRKLTVATRGLSRLDTLVDGHPFASTALGATANTSLTYPAGTKVVDLTAFDGEVVRQRRRILLAG